MCFRPASLSKPVECPNCKKKIAAMAGIKQKKCPFCGTPLPDENAEKNAKPEKPENPDTPAK